MSVSLAGLFLLFSVLPWQATDSPATVRATPAPAWGDFDRDGLQDVFVFHPGAHDRLLRDAGGGAFEDVSEVAGLGELSASRSAAWGDYDKDGWVDLFVTAEAGGGQLFRNLHDGAFEDRTRDAGLAELALAAKARWFDYDQDGFVDLVLENAEGSRLIHNRGNGTFEAIVLSVLLQPLSPVAGVAPAASFVGSGTAESDRAHAGATGLVLEDAGKLRAASSNQGTGSTYSFTALPGTNPGGGVEKAGSGSSGFVPSGGMILGESQNAPNGYTFTGQSVWADPTSTAVVVKAPMPSARGYLGIAAVNGKIYAIGGYDGGGPVPTVEEYDPATNTWTSKASLPTERFGLAAAVVNGKIFAIGGTYLGNLPTVEEYDPLSDSWTTKANMPSSRTYAAAAATNGKVYVIGGYGSVPISTVEEYDPGLDSWTTKASMPTARYLLGGAAMNGKIYAIGGYNSSSLSTVEEYDPSTNTWTAKASTLTARAHGAAAAVNGKIYAIGGHNGSVWLSTGEGYDPGTNSWIGGPNMLSARGALGAAAVNGRIYAIGGYDGGGYLSTVEELNPGRPLYVHKKN